MRSNKEHKDCVKYKEEGYKGQDIMEGCSVQEEEEAELEDYQRPAECFHYLSDVCTVVDPAYILQKLASQYSFYLQLSKI